MKLENIETERFILRQVNNDDRNEIFEILSDDETVRYLNMEIHNDIKMTDELINNYLIGLEKAGFRLEKVFHVDGIEEDIKSYLITKEEYVNG